MKLRTLFFVVVALVVLCAIAWFAQRPPAPTTPDARVGQSLLPPEIAARARGLKLTDQGKAVELRRQADDRWTVASYHDFPADFPKLSRFVSDLSEARLQRLVTARADRLSRLEFKDTTIALTGEDGKELWQVTLGRNADGGGRYVRFGAEEKAFLANLTAWLDAESKNWADTRLFALKPEEVARFELGFPASAHPPFVATREKADSPWTPEPAGDRRLKTEKIASLLSSLNDVRFTETTELDSPAAAAARDHRRTLKLTTFAGTTHTLTFSRVPEIKKPKAPAADTAKSSEASADAASAGPAPAEPEFETVPAGPVFLAIESSATGSPLAELMKRRAFQVSEWIFTNLPSIPEDLWETSPSAPPAPGQRVPASGEPEPSPAPQS